MGIFAKRAKKNAVRVAKIAASSILSIAVAKALGLSYFVSAGIITLLSLQETKKETLATAIRRAASYALAIAAAYLSFGALGFGLLSLGAFLFLFVFFSYATGLVDAIAICAVMATHFWGEKSLSLAFLANETAVLAVGVATAVAFNLFLPVNLKNVRLEQKKADEGMKSLLRALGETVASHKRFPKEEAEALFESLADSRASARNAMRNSLSTDLSYFVDYFDMRRSQLALLCQMAEAAERMESHPKQSLAISGLICSVADGYAEENAGEASIPCAESLKDYFRSEELPQTRSEFEARATLFSILAGMQSFLLLKRSFAGSVSKEDRERYWQAREDPEKKPA